MVISFVFFYYTIFITKSGLHNLIFLLYIDSCHTLNSLIKTHIDHARIPLPLNVVPYRITDDFILIINMLIWLFSILVLHQLRRLDVRIVI